MGTGQIYWWDFRSRTLAFLQLLKEQALSLWGNASGACVAGLQREMGPNGRREVGAYSSAMAWLFSSLPVLSLGLACKIQALLSPRRWWHWFCCISAGGNLGRKMLLWAELQYTDRIPAWYLKNMFNVSDPYVYVGIGVLVWTYFHTEALSTRRIEGEGQSFCFCFLFLLYLNCKSKKLLLIKLD